ncbi:LutC/YkgG family protein [Sulfurirhabdus autotrophica]|uniref:L-lactate dehydrogenase complex protein LldG n=1 Tax=Sulfurirhabdus autotrophica TaxID=1706046 RepID=A0A4R3XV86_9PROT|nr:lactate utilization protein C [Sulfurirhabdus autotrophica]TCV82892.1 L-lactate dehydrogenase complex protein LldG [Sulfurirhabdus autotrophica]
MNARERMLARLAAHTMNIAETIGDMDAYIARHNRGPIPAIGRDLVACFRDRAAKLSSDVTTVSSLLEVPTTAAAYLRERNLPVEAVCWPELETMDWRTAGITVQARSAIGSDLVGITGAFCGIAETGTLMFLSGATTPATVSLLPETHIAILPASRVVSSMEDAWVLLRKEFGKLPRAVNFVSGPSRTADIEQTVTLGAHGPYRVFIILTLSE